MGGKASKEYRHQYYLLHKDEILRKNREYRAKHRDEERVKRRARYFRNHDKEKEVRREWRVKNAVKVREYNHEYFRQHPDKNIKWRKQNLPRAKELDRIWRITNPQKKQESVMRRRVRQIGNGVEKYSRIEVIRRDGSRCHICGKKVKKTEITLDHLIPISRGGQDIFSNVRVAHKSCNSARGPGRIPAQLMLTI